MVNAKPSVTIRSHVVQLARSGPEPIDPDRLEMHRKLAHALSRGKRQRKEIAEISKPLSFEELTIKPAIITKLLTPEEELPDETITIIDLSESTYALLNDRFLRHLAESIGDQCKKPKQIAVILFSKVPRKSISTFWKRLSGNEIDGRVILADRQGEIFNQQGQRLRDGEAKKLRQIIKESNGQLHGSAQERFEKKLLRRIGHFTLRHTGAPDTCTRYYYDGSNCSHELRELASDWLLDRFTPSELEESSLIVHAPSSPWMEEAALILGVELNVIDTIVLADDLRSQAGRTKPEMLSPKRNIVLLDMIVSGSTMEKVLAVIKEWDVPLAPEGLAALSALEEPRHEDPAVIFTALKSVVQRRHKIHDCPRCRLGAPRNPASPDEPYLMLPSDDLWEVLLDVSWGPENYGSADSNLYPYIPNLSEAFEKYGDWIAYMYERLLNAHGYTSEVIVVCPQEPAVEALVERLSTRFENRAVAVLVPRKVIDEAAKGTLPDPNCSPVGSHNDWHDQLNLLRDSNAAVVAIDEFNSSGSTAAGLNRLLGRFGVKLSAYLPFIDWGDMNLMEQTPAHPLYAFPYPRPR